MDSGVGEIVIKKNLHQSKVEKILQAHALVVSFWLKFQVEIMSVRVALSFIKHVCV